MTAADSVASHCEMKLAPMNPAPPVTMILVCVMLPMLNHVCLKVAILGIIAHPVEPGSAAFATHTPDQDLVHGRRRALCSRSQQSACMHIRVAHRSGPGTGFRRDKPTPGKNVSRALYSLALYLLLPWALLHLVLRARKQPAYLEHVGERFGIFEDGMPSGVIWIHAVSVGETRAAEPLIKALQKRHSEHRILLTHGTPTGRQTGVELYGDRVERCYLPYDFGWATRRFLRRFRPVVGICMETEIWPNLIHAGVQSKIPVYLVNARMSEKSARGYRRIGRLTGAALRELSRIGAQTDRDARRFLDLGARDVM